MSIRARISKRVVSLFMSDWSRGTIESQRARQEKNRRLARLPADVRCHSVDANGVSAAWIEPSTVETDVRADTKADAEADVKTGAKTSVILYLHGGAYALGSVNVHREFIARVAKASRVRCLAINYRLAPEHPFPAALEDTMTAYRWLLSQDIDPARIIFGGDSAGGGLAIAALLTLRDDGEASPGGAFCISPWLDLALTGDSFYGKAKVDPILDPESLRTYAGYYAGNYARTNPLISPLYANLEGLPPLLIQVGTDEILLDDATRFAEKALESGIDIKLETWDSLFHAFHMFAFLPETKIAIEAIAAFANDRIKSYNTITGVDG